MSENYWEQEVDCPTCGGSARILGSLGLTNHYACQNCGTHVAVDAVRDTVVATPGQSQVERFALACARHKSLISKGGLP